MNRTEIKVWDPLVRVFHWTLVASFAICWVTEDDLMGLHSFAGYTVMALLLVRLVWGFVGPAHARFADFVKPPRETIAYLKEIAALRPRRYVGHNPAGGAMTVALMISLALTALTGLAAYGSAGGGPLAGWLQGFDLGGMEALEEMHEFLANFTLLLVALHLAGVAFESLFHRENLVRAMFTGVKRAGPQDGSD